MAKMRKLVGDYEISLQDAFNEFVQEKRALNLSAHTIQTYEKGFAKFCAYHPNIDKVNELSESHLFSWINHMRDVDGLKPASINTHLTTMRTFINWCINKDYIYKLKVKLVRGQEELPRLFTDDEIDVLLQKPTKKDTFVTWRTYTTVAFVLATGQRSSTIRHIKMEDIDLKSGTFSVKHQKNKKASILPISGALTTTLKEYINYWRRNADDKDYLFPTEMNTELSYNGLQGAFEKYCKDRGLEHWNFHGLRHSYSSLFIRNNGNPMVLQRMLGHSTLEMTRRYISLFGTQLKEGYDDFSPLDSIKKSRVKKVNK